MESQLHATFHWTCPSLLNWQAGPPVIPTPLVQGQWRTGAINQVIHRLPDCETRRARRAAGVLRYVVTLFHGGPNCGLASDDTAQGYAVKIKGCNELKHMKLLTLDCFWFLKWQFHMVHPIEAKTFYGTTDCFRPSLPSQTPHPTNTCKSEGSESSP